MPVSLSLVVLRCSDLAASRCFYEAVGLSFTAEQHGSGPKHLSSTIGGTVLELYPASDCGPTVARLGFCVLDVEASVRAAVGAGGRLRGSREKGGGRAVLLDPDDNVIELSSADLASSRGDS